MKSELVFPLISLISVLYEPAFQIVHPLLESVEGMRKLRTRVSDDEALLKSG